MASNTETLAHATAVVESDSVGAGTTVLAYARIAAGAVVGERCTIHDHALVGAGVLLGDDVTVGAGAVLDGELSEQVVVGSGARIGANATIYAGVTIGRGAVVQPGSVVDADVPAHSIVSGSPALIVAYVDALPETTEPAVTDLSSLDAPLETGVPGVVLYPLTTARDLRGSLAAIEFADLPFVPRRTFVVYGAPNESVRGTHAHRACAQLLICVSGEISCIADDGSARQEFRLTTPAVGLYVPPMIWSMQYRTTPDAVLVVLAEHPYDPDDYIRNYEEFLGLAARG